MSGINKFSREGQRKIHHDFISKEKVALFPKKKLAPGEKVIPSEEFEKGTNLFNDMEEQVHTIRRKYLDKFQGKSTGSTGWLNLDHEWLKRNFLYLNPITK